MKDKAVHCAMCGNHRDKIMEDASAHSIIRSPHTKNILCSTCVKNLFRFVMATEKAMKEAIEENEQAKADGIVLNENGECMCVSHIFERKKAILEKTDFSATETTGTRH